MANSRPYIILSAAISIDGKIATSTGDSKFSSDADLLRLHKLRSKIDAILVGKNTILSDDPLLTVRRIRGPNPIRIILDSHGSIPSNTKILQTSSDIPTIIATTRHITKRDQLRLHKLSAKVLVVGTRSINLELLLEKLYNRGIRTVLVEGGGTTNWEFVRHNLFDELVVTVSPFLVGGKNSISLIEGLGFAKLSDSPSLCLKSTKRLQNHLVLTYINM